MGQEQVTRKQHLISKVLLRQFATVDDELMSYDLRYGKASPRHPSRVGWIRDFVAEQSVELESLWNTSEDAAGNASAAAVAGNVFDNPDDVLTLKNLIALHFMRNTRVKALWNVGFQTSLLNVSAPPHFPGNRDVLEAVVRHQTAKRGATWFAEQQRESFEKSARLVATAGLEVVVSSDAPVLVGDRSVISAYKTPDGYRFEYVPFSNASTHILPIGPRHLVALSKEDKYIYPEADWIDRLNQHQIFQAHSHVFFSPTDTELEERVSAIRAKATGS